MHLEFRLRSLVRLHAIRTNAAKSVCAVFFCGVMCGAAPALASAPLELVDVRVLSDLEQRASTANVREQALLYAELADKMTVLAGQQLADGQIDDAEKTLARIEACTSRMENGLQQSKSLKKTELLLHMTNRRLSDMVRAASSDVKPHVQDVLKHLNTAQTSLLSLIFAK